MSAGSGGAPGRPARAREASNGVPLAGGRAELSRALGTFLARQEWAQSALGILGARRLPTRVVDVEVLNVGAPGFASVIVDAGEPASSRLHVLVGWRPVAEATAALLRADAVIAAGSDDSGELLLYEALADGALRLQLLEAATGGRERARSARVVRSLTSHAALVYDDRLFMKCYRVIEPRERPESEVQSALEAVGYRHLLANVARWTREGRDLGLVREFVPGAVEGRALALTSLRDLLARAASGERLRSFEEVGIAGGDLGYEMRRLGATTAELHLALAEAFGVRQAKGRSGAAPLVRVHGDYHLRRVMRVDAGWIVVGFGDDPLLGTQAGAASQGGARFAPALEDVADLTTSLGQVAAEAASLQPASSAEHSRLLTEGWVAHNTRQLLAGYVEVTGIERLAPRSVEAIERWLRSRRGAVTTRARSARAPSAPPGRRRPSPSA